MAHKPDERRDGGFEISKSRTYRVPLAKLFDAFAKPRVRARWLPGTVTVLGATPLKRMRLSFADDTRAEIGFTAKGDAKSTVGLAHFKLADRIKAIRGPG